MAATFTYKGAKTTGETVTGQVEATNRSEAVKRLYEMGLTPITVTDTDRRSWLDILATDIGGSGHMRGGEITALTREMATLLHAGLPIDKALNLLAELAERPVAKKAIEDILGRIRRGSTLVDALAAQGPGFSADFLAMVRAGEAGGRLEVVLGQLARNREAAETLRGSVRSAMIYPVILLFMAGGTVAVLLTLVLPQFEPLFAGAGADLPWITQALMAVGDFAGAYGWLVLLAAILGGIGFMRARQGAAFRLAVDRRLLRLPIIGKLAATVDIARFSRSLGMLLEGGVSLLRALEIARGTLTNAALDTAVVQAIGQVRAGR